MVIPPPIKLPRILQYFRHKSFYFSATIYRYGSEKYNVFCSKILNAIRDNLIGGGISHKKSKLSFGFGLIELIVSISIVAIVVGIVVARHNAFNGAILLRNQAYEIAFVIKEAQQLAVSGSQTETLTTTQKQRYGVAFSTGASGDVNRQAIVLYKDNNVNGLYDSDSDGDELIKTYRLDSRFEITGIVENTSPANITQTRVLFERPFFDAKFYKGNGTNTTAIGPVKITISPVVRGSGVVPERVINISSAGQVMVESN